MVLRFVKELGGFLRQPFDLDRELERVARQLASRESTFLAVLDRGVFKRSSSPYLFLMQEAGIHLSDVEELVRKEGVEGTLSALFDAGVRISLEEFKGLRPVRRSGVDREVQASYFDNPLARAHYEGRTGGSRGSGTRLIVDLDLLRYEAAHVVLSLQALGALDRPAALWRPLPPGVTGIKELLYRARIDRLPEVWFSQNRYHLRGEDARAAAFAASAIGGSRLWGRPLPVPTYLPLGRAAEISEWLALKTSSGTPALLDTNVSSAIRVCRAADEGGYDISGTIFRTGGEPLTPGRAQIIEQTNSRVACNYGIAEAGRLGLACGDSSLPDDVHLLADKVAVLQRPHLPVAGGPEVDALFVTTLHPATPKLMLNVEIGDYAVRSNRQCECTLGRFGFDEHLHTIRSYEKLTSEGMHFLGSDLLELLERVLPERFGGGADDYQLVEEEVDGLARVSLLVSPRLGPVEEWEITDVFFGFLQGGGQGRAMMSQWWKDGSTLSVERREPLATGAAKVLPLHIRRGDPSVKPGSPEIRP